MRSDRFDPRYFERDVLFRYHAGWAGLDHSRPSPATYLDRSGILRTAGPDVPRVEWLDLDGDGVRETPTTLVEGAGENLIPGSAQTFEGWTAFGGATVTVTQGQTIQPTADAPGSPEGAATRIQTSGGSDEIKLFYSVGAAGSEQTVAISVLVYNQGVNAALIAPNLGSGHVTIQPGETRRVEITATHSGAVQRHLQIRAADPTHALDVVAYGPQIEVSPVVTSLMHNPDAGVSTVERALDQTYTDWPHAARQALTIYLRLIRGTASGETRWLVLGANANPRLMLRTITGTDVRCYIANATNSTAATLATGTEVGTPLEVLLTMESDGSGTLAASVDGAAALTTPVPAPIGGLPPAWSSTRLWLGGIEGLYAGRDWYRDVLVLRGSDWTLDAVRRVLPW